MENFLTEAFKKLKLVEEDINLSQSGMINKGLVDDDIEVEEEEIIDVNAGDDDEVQDSYVGKIIIMCPCCQSKFYKDKEDVRIDDGTANKDEQCAICKCTQGFNILGKVVELEDEKEDDGEEEEEHEEIKESLDDRIHRKHLIDLVKDDDLDEDATEDEENMPDPWGKDREKNENFAVRDDDLDEDATEDEENMPDPWGKDRKKNENFAVRNRSNGRYLDKYFTVTSRDEKNAQKFATKEEAEKAINPDGKFDTWEDTFEIVDLKEGASEAAEYDEKYDVNESVNINATGEDTVDVEKNDDGTMTVNFGTKVKGPGEAIAPLTDEEKDELEEPTEDETEDEIEDVDSETFDEIGESFLTKVYSNVSTFNTTKVKANNDNIVVEGVITYLNGMTRKTEFTFNEAKETTSGHIILEGTNKALTNANKALFLRGSVKDKKFVSESLIYRYASKTVNESTDKPKNIYGRVAIKK